MAKVPQNIIEDIKERSDIVELIQRYIPLRRAGANLKANCPFHKEKTPSFVVSPQKQIYHCFGCHAGGNVFTFISEYEKISFYEALKRLANEQGIDLSKYQDTYEDANRTAKGLLLELNKEAAEIYHLALKNNEFASSYFRNREITDEIVEKFKLGYAPNEWNYLESKLNDKKNALKIGLITEKDQRFYDRFRHRIIFPIDSISKDIVGFGGRRLEENQNPKYLNSSESEIYNKRYVLYGLSYAIDKIKEKNACFLVEGYMDVLRCHQFGIENVVASSGTALTEQHARLIARYCKNIYLMFDSDSAGIQAAIRSISILLKQNMDIKVVPMPKGADPDSILQKFGKSAFEKYVSKSLDFIDFQYRYYSKSGLLKTEEQKSILIKQIGDQINQIEDFDKKQLLLNRIGKGERSFGINLVESINHRVKRAQRFSNHRDDLNEDEHKNYMNHPSFKQEKELLCHLLNTEKEFTKSYCHTYILIYLKIYTTKT
jgi:DNA primase